VKLLGDRNDQLVPLVHVNFRVPLTHHRLRDGYRAGKGPAKGHLLTLWPLSRKSGFIGHGGAGVCPGAGSLDVRRAVRHLEAAFRIFLSGGAAYLRRPVSPPHLARCNMKTKYLRIILAGCIALGAFKVALAEETITGNVGGDTPQVTVIPANVLNLPMSFSGLLRFKLRAVSTSAQAHTPYTMNFCVGPASNPCGLSTSIVYTVPGDTAVFALLNASAFDHGNVMTVSVGTAATVGYEISLE
jgi:hypothetical protein